MRNYDLISLLSDAGIATTIVSNGSELRAACPLCGDHKERFFVNRRTYLWGCHNCDEAGNLYRLCEVVLDLDPVETYRVVQNIDDRVRRVEITPVERMPDMELPPSIPLVGTSPDSIITKPFWDYLLGSTRKVPIADVIDYDMRACLTGQYAMRVLVPVRQEARIVTFVARSIYLGCACQYAQMGYDCQHHFRKVLYPIGTFSSRILFNIDRVSGNEEVVLVEGAFDAIRLKDKAVASLGSSLSTEQMDLMRRHGIKNVTILWDPDKAGQKGTRRSARELVGNGFGVRVATLPEGTDPALASSVVLTRALDLAMNESVLCSTTELRRRLRRTTQEEAR